MADNFPDMDEILAQMKDKFLETAQEKLDRLSEILEALALGEGNNELLLEELRRDIHSLKGMGGTFQMPLVTKLCHAFEAFIEEEDEFTLEIIDASHQYLDRITDLIDSDEAGDEAKLSKWMESLPQKISAGQKEETDTGDTPKVLIISENFDHSSVVRNAFEGSGFSVVIETSPVNAFATAFKINAGIVICSQIFKDMDGAEFLRAISGTNKYSKAKFAMICPDRRKALEENLPKVQLLSEKNIEKDVYNFIAIAITA